MSFNDLGTGSIEIPCIPHEWVWGERPTINSNRPRICALCGKIARCWMPGKEETGNIFDVMFMGMKERKPHCETCRCE